MCLLGANLFKDILNQTKWKLEIFSHICLSEQAQRFNSFNHVFFKDANILLEVLRLFSHFFCDLAHEIFYMAHNFFNYSLADLSQFLKYSLADQPHWLASAWFYVLPKIVTEWSHLAGIR